MSGVISDLALADRQALAAWIGERSETVLAVATLLAGDGRVWVDGDVSAPNGVLAESPLVPGEPQAFGNPDVIMRLLERADTWRCVEVDPALADTLASDFDRRWGLERTVVDVVHALFTPVEVRNHPAVRSLTAAEAVELPRSDASVLAVGPTTAAAAASGFVHAAVVDGEIVGHGSSLASGSSFADVAVHVDANHRSEGIATAAASQTCRALQQAGFTPVWGTGSHNEASMRVARRLGFVEVTRLHCLVRTVRPEHEVSTQQVYDRSAQLYVEVVGTVMSSRTETAADLAHLDAFADRLLSDGTGPVVDIGCGTGRATAYLADCDVDIRGIDLSARMVEIARAAHPTLRFDQGSLTSLGVGDGSSGGAVLWYSIIHTPLGELDAVWAELRRVLHPGAPALIAFQAGADEQVERPDAYGSSATLVLQRHGVGSVARSLRTAGFEVLTESVRPPELEHETTPQAFVVAQRLPD